MFIKLTHNQDHTPLHLAISEIARFWPCDAYRPSDASTVVLKSGDKFQVSENTDKIAALIAAMSPRWYRSL
jgi:hypothetical protein